MPEFNEQQYVTGRQQPSIQDIISPLVKHRAKIVLFSFFTACLTLGLNLLLPVYYKSTATLLPETEKGKLSALEQFADVAQLAGVKMPGSEVSRLYPIIVSSETILRSVIERKYRTEQFPDSVNLIAYFELNEDTPAEDMYEALKEMEQLMSTAFESKTGLVEISVEMREPQLAADVLNAIVGELDGFMRLKKVTSASEQRKWVEVRLGQVREELREAEEKLKFFREKNRRVIDSPELLLDQERLLRNVQVKSAIFIELTKQSELAKIEEVKNITVVNVLDPGRPSVKKERPRRVINTVAVFIVSLLLLSLWHIIRSMYGERIRAVFAKAQRV